MPNSIELSSDDEYDLPVSEKTPEPEEIDPNLPSTSGIANGSSNSNRSGKLKRQHVGSVESTEDVTTKKSKTAMDREAKKQKMAEAKAAKMIMNEKNKVYKPGECMKYMSIEAHPSLCESWYMSNVAQEAAAAGTKLVTSPALCNPALLVWTRTVPQTLQATQGQVQLTKKTENCDRALYVTEANSISVHVCERSLTAHLSETRDLVGCSMTLVICGVDNYFKSSRRQTSNSNRSTMTKIDLEMAITDLLVGANCDTVCVNTPNELAQLIIQFTKAIAEKPFKLAKYRASDEQAEFYMRGDNKNCVAIDKTGAGVSRLWQQMVAVLPQSSLETSRALCAQYKSPLALYEALQSPNGLNEVADIGVARSAVPGSKERKIGPEFARKLHKLFTAQDGSVLVD